MAFVRKVNRTCTPSHCTRVFRYELHRNYPNKGFVKKSNCLFAKKEISFITKNISFTHLKVLYFHHHNDDLQLH